MKKIKFLKLENEINKIISVSNGEDTYTIHTNTDNIPECETKISEGLFDTLCFYKDSEKNFYIHKDITVLTQAMDLFQYDDKITLKAIKTNILLVQETERFSRINNDVNGMMLLTSMLVLQSKFGEYGIFINDANKEEQYIELINRDCPDLLEYLQEYLELLDEYKYIQAGYDTYRNNINEIKNGK